MIELYQRIDCAGDDHRVEAEQQAPERTGQCCLDQLWIGSHSLHPFGYDSSLCIQCCCLPARSISPRTSARTLSGNGGVAELCCTTQLDRRLANSRMQFGGQPCMMPNSKPAANESPAPTGCTSACFNVESGSLRCLPSQASRAPFAPRVIATGSQLDTLARSRSMNRIMRSSGSVDSGVSPNRKATSSSSASFIFTTVANLRLLVMISPL